MHIRRWEDVLDVFWMFYLRSIYVLCLLGYDSSWEKSNLPTKSDNCINTSHRFYSMHLFCSQAYIIFHLIPTIFFLWWFYKRCFCFFIFNQLPLLIMPVMLDILSLLVKFVNYATSLQRCVINTVLPAINQHFQQTAKNYSLTRLPI